MKDNVRKVYASYCSGLAIAVKTTSPVMFCTRLWSCSTTVSEGHPYEVGGWEGRGGATIKAF